MHSTCGLAKASEKFQKRGSQVIKRGGEFTEPPSVCDLARLSHTTPKHTQQMEQGWGEGERETKAEGIAETVAR